MIWNEGGFAEDLIKKKTQSEEWKGERIYVRWCKNRIASRCYASLIMRSQKKVLSTIVGNVTNDLYYKNVKNSRPWVLRRKVSKNHWNASDKKSLFGTAERLVVYNFTKIVPCSCIFLWILRDISGELFCGTIIRTAFSDSDEAAERLRKSWKWSRKFKIDSLEHKTFPNSHFYLAAWFTEYLDRLVLIFFYVTNRSKPYIELISLMLSFQARYYRR